MIYMDAARPVRFRRFAQSSHLMSDLPGAEGTAELDAFARRLGLRAEWRQNTGTATEHYDLFDGTIDKARRGGAVVVTSRDLVEFCVRPKRVAP